MNSSVLCESRRTHLGIGQLSIRFAFNLKLLVTTSLATHCISLEACVLCLVFEEDVLLRIAWHSDVGKGQCACSSAYDLFALLHAIKRAIRLALEMKLLLCFSD